MIPEPVIPHAVKSVELGSKAERRRTAVSRLVRNGRRASLDPKLGGTKHAWITHTPGDGHTASEGEEDWRSGDQESAGVEPYRCGDQGDGGAHCVGSRDRLLGPSVADPRSSASSGAGEQRRVEPRVGFMRREGLCDVGNGCDSTGTPGGHGPVH